MRILMLGNSLTTANDLPGMLARLLDAEVTVQARGGARLAEHLNEKTKMGGRTQELLLTKHFDFVILQEMSKGPAVSPEKYMDSVIRLSQQIRENGAVPVVYGTWGYAQGSEKLAKTGMTFEEMNRKMKESCRLAAEKAGALLADVCSAFEGNPELYSTDGVHPSAEGSEAAAEVIRNVITNSLNI